jgi:hypothetical protein
MSILIEFISMLVKEKQLTVNTAVSIAVLAIALLAYYAEMGNGKHLDRIDHHLQSEDSDIGLVRQALDDHGIHVNEQHRDESPRQRGEEDDMDNSGGGGLTNLSNAVNNQPR